MAGPGPRPARRAAGILSRVRRPGLPEGILNRVPRLLHGAPVPGPILGAVSRSGLKRLVVGNTAEAVFDALACDILVVKPAGFRNTVPSRVRGPAFVLPADSGVSWL